jgi:tetratricopeptide (TPR) repeat protein
MNSIIEKQDMIFDEYNYVDFPENNTMLQIAYENMEDGLYHESAQLFFKFLTDNPATPEVLNGLTVCLFEMQKFERAMQLIDYGLKAFPDDPITLSNKASICWQMDNYDEAIYYYTLSIAMNPDLSDSYINLVNLYREHGDILLAYSECLKIKGRFPDNDEIKSLADDILLDVALMFY